jgi:hypothetical protein
MGTPIGVLWWGGSEGSAGLGFPFTPSSFPTVNDRELSHRWWEFRGEGRWSSLIGPEQAKLCNVAPSLPEGNFHA